MDTKLTLKLDKDTIERMKIYARNRNVSLSRMVEKYFQAIISTEHQKDIKLTPLVQELSGIVSKRSIQDDLDSYTDYLIEKY